MKVLSKVSTIAGNLESVLLQAWSHWFPICLALGTCLVLSGTHAHAEVSMDKGDSKYIFKVGGKIVSPIQAAQAAPTNEIERCAPVKGAVKEDGSDAVVYKCKAVKLEYKAKTGVPTWKTK